MDNLCEQFNNIVLNLISQLSRYSNKSYECRFTLLIKLNKNIPIERFALDISDYKTKIIEKDENCFMNMNIKKFKMMMVV